MRRVVVVLVIVDTGINVRMTMSLPTPNEATSFSGVLECDDSSRPEAVVFR